VLDVIVGDAQPVEFIVVGTRAGLPRVAARLARARPATARAQYGPDAAIAIGHARF
jgi:hypothetical protein